MHAHAWSLHTGVLGGMRTPIPNRPLPLVNQVPVVQLFLVLICPTSVFTISKFPLFSKVVWVLGEPWPLRLYLPGFWQYLAPQRFLSWGKSSSSPRAKAVFSLRSGHFHILLMCLAPLDCRHWKLSLLSRSLPVCLQVALIFSYLPGTLWDFRVWRGRPLDFFERR